MGYDSISVGSIRCGMISSPSHFLGFREQGTQGKEREDEINEGDIIVPFIIRIPPNFYFPGVQSK